MKKKQLDCDFLIIGGGTIGLPVAVWLSEKTNKDVICLEAGYETHDNYNFFGSPKIIGNNYMGAKLGRRFCLGGTSTVWGGALSPFLQSDTTLYNWEVTSKDLEKYIPDVEKIFKLPSSDWNEDLLENQFGEYILRAAIWPSFANRNTYKLLKNRLIRCQNLRLLKNTPVISIDAKNSKHIVYVNNVDFEKISCKKIIVCAGAIESTRIALRLSNNYFIGKGFSDHLSAPVGKILSKNLDSLNKEFSFKFSKNNSMKNFRFEMSNHSNNRELLPPHNFHVSFISKISENNTFNHLRSIFRHLQRGEVPQIRDLSGLIKNSKWFIRLAFWRFFHKCLLRPEDSIPEIHLVIQQEISDANRIELDHAALDEFGNSVPKIYWKLNSKDKENINNAIYSFYDFWQKNLSDKYGSLELYDKDTIIKNFMECGGIYHPTSSLKFGKDDKSPLDENLYLKNIRNIQFLSTAILPTGGGVNPTMMALLFAARCVDQHISKNS